LPAIPLPVAFLGACLLQDDPGPVQSILPGKSERLDAQSYTRSHDMAGTKQDSSFKTLTLTATFLCTLIS
jgi:hypothetical protein